PRPPSIPAAMAGGNRTTTAGASPACAPAITDARSGLGSTTCWLNAVARMSRTAQDASIARRLCGNSFEGGGGQPEPPSPDSLDGDGDEFGHDRRLVRDVQVIAQHHAQRV